MGEEGKWRWRAGIEQKFEMVYGGDGLEIGGEQRECWVRGGELEGKDSLEE